MNLSYAIWKILAECWHLRLLIQAGGDHYVVSTKTSHAGFDDIAKVGTYWLDGMNIDAITHRQFKSAHVAFEVVDNLFAGKKTIGSCTRDVSSWRHRLPVRGVQGERIP